MIDETGADRDQAARTGRRARRFDVHADPGFVHAGSFVRVADTVSTSPRAHGAHLPRADGRRSTPRHEAPDDAGTGPGPEVPPAAAGRAERDGRHPRVGAPARRRARRARGRELGRRDGGGGGRWRRRRRRRVGRLRPPRHDARLLAGGARAIPGDRQDRRLRGPAEASRPRSRCRAPRRRARSRRYPGDCDFFERVHITAESRDAACPILRDLMREKALSTMVGRTYRLWEVKFGVYPFDAERDGKPCTRAERSRGRRRRSWPARSP